MLKFAVEKPDQRSVFLGLSHENVRRLQDGSAIQFQATEVGLDQGIVVIAHSSDRDLGVYRDAAKRQLIRDLLVLTEADCRRLREDIIEMPLARAANGRSCRSYLFSGRTEEGMVRDLERAGLITPETNIQSPTCEYKVGVLHQLKLWGTFAMMTVVAISMTTVRKTDGLVSALTLAFALIALGALVLALMAPSERIEITRDRIRRISPLFGFDIACTDVNAVLARSDSLGPYEVVLEMRDGSRHRLKRIYGNWKELVADLAHSRR